MKYTFCSLLLCSQVVLANPLGEAVVGGDVQFARPTESELHVSQSSERAIVDWDHFSIKAGELTKFIQPGPDSVLLNRVVGQEISSIYGKLEANGQIVLMNPHGVFVGKTGVIDACSFLAASHDVSNVDFMEGKFEFGKTNFEGVINVEGRIEANRVDRIGGCIFLVADEVEIEGRLVSPSGEIEVQGNQIVLTSDSVIDVSGFGRGSGGRAVIVGEKSAASSGSIFSKGGEFGGDGGFIEVSSRGQLGLAGTVSTTAPFGQVGMFLIDPTDVTISSAADSNTTGPAYYFTGNPVNIDAATLCGFLNSSSVTISTANTVDQGQTGILTIDATADFSTWTAATSLLMLVNSDMGITAGATIGSLGTGVGGSFLAQVGGSITVDAPIYTNGGNISLRAGPLSGISGFSASGSVNLNQALDTTQGGGVGGAITVQGFDITATNASVHATNSGNISFLADQDVISTTPNTFLITDTGAITVYANRNINLTQTSDISSTGSFSGLQIDIQADYDHDGVGDFLFEASAGSSSAISALGGGNIFIGGQNVTVQGASPAAGDVSVRASGVGTIEVQAHQDFTLAGSNGGGGSGNAQLITGAPILVRAGRDINLLGGSADSSLARINATAFGLSGTATLIAGRDIQMFGGSANTTGGAGVIGDLCTLIAGGDITVTPGPSAQGNAIITSSGQTTVMHAGGDILFSLDASGSTGEIFDFTIGCDVRAGGDIVWARSLTMPDSAQSIYIAADATVIPLYSPQVGPYLAGTVLATGANVISDGKGAFSVDTSPIGGGIQLSTFGFGSISLYSAPVTTGGATANLVFDETTTNNAVKMLSFTGGNISVAGFHNIDVDNTISTTGSILISADNNMNINVPAGFITVGGTVTLIVDEQTPFTNGGGFFNNFNSGVSTTDPDQRIAIYAASGPQAPAGFSFPNQVVLGNLSSVETWDINKPLGLLSKYGTSYEAGGPIHGGGFGTSYVAGNGVFSSPVIWYKVFQSLTGITNEALDALKQIQSLMPERLWVQEFSILIDRKAFREQIKVLMNRNQREGTIQSRYALASSKDYFLRSTMSGENIRLMDRYQEFEQSPFWRTPEMLKTLYWLEDRK